jgi:hypothetical protein
MLIGDSDPSNADPIAATPAAREDWVTSSAHVMLAVPGGFDAKQFSTDPASGQPYIMRDGTPCEHLMRFSASWFLRRKETGHRLYLRISRTRNPPSCAPVNIVVWLYYVCSFRALMRGYHFAPLRGWIERRAPPQFRRQRSGARRVPDSAGVPRTAVPGAACFRARRRRQVHAAARVQTAAGVVVLIRPFGSVSAVQTRRLDGR